MFCCEWVWGNVILSGVSFLFGEFERGGSKWLNLPLGGFEMGHCELDGF